MNRTQSRVLLALLLVLCACRKDAPKADVADASADASADDGDVVDMMGNRKKYRPTPEDGRIVYDPKYVVVGDSFVVSGQINGFCAPRDDWAPPGLATFLGDEITPLKFAGPRNPYQGHYRAVAKGQTRVNVACSRGDDKGQTVSHLELTILDPADAMPFVTTEPESSYAAYIPLALETLRAGALACFTEDLARDPKVRGIARADLLIQKDGSLNAMTDNSMAYVKGLSPAGTDCFRNALQTAAAAQKKPDPTNTRLPTETWKETLVPIELRFVFGMVPKIVDPKACDQYAARWKACERVRESSRYIPAHDLIIGRTKVAKTDEARTALAFACKDAMDDLNKECR